MRALATLYNYAIPQNIRWNYSQSNRLGIPDGGISGTTIAWDSQYYTFQCQYRQCSRLSPAAQAIAGVADPWGAWGAWQDPESAVSGDIKSTTQKSGLKSIWTGNPFSFAYDFSNYDMHKIQFRVRVFDEGSLTCSDWAYYDLLVVYRPIATATAEYLPDGGARISVTTNWTRGGGSFSVSETRYCMYNVNNLSLGPYWNLTRWWPGGSVALQAGSASMDVPPVALQDGHIYMCGLQLVTGDGAQATWPSNVYALDCAADQHAIDGTKPTPPVYDVPIAAHSNPPDVDEPTVTATSTGDGDLLVSVTGGTWDNVLVSCAWTDARGVISSASVGMSDDGAAWNGVLVAPPFDVPVTITAAGVAGAKFATDSATATVPSEGAVELRHLSTGEAVRIKYDHRDTVQRRFTPEVETYKPAGATRPKSRYGEGGAMSLGISGTTPEVGATGGYLTEQGLAAWVQAESPGDWLLRIPGGERYSVALTSFAINNGGAPGWYDVALELEVVE